MPPPPPPPGKYVNDALKILGSASSSNKKKRRSECIADLERLVPPLFSQSALHSSSLLPSEKKSDEVDSSEKKDCTTTTEEATDEGAVQVDEDATKEVEESTNQRNIKRLKSQLQHYKQLNEQETKRRQKFLSSFVSFHTMYESGLDFVARMGDLRNVPDNVMPDEFPKL